MRMFPIVKLLMSPRRDIIRSYFRLRPPSYPSNTKFHKSIWLASPFFAQTGLSSHQIESDLPQPVSRSFILGVHLQHVSFKAHSLEGCFVPRPSEYLLPEEILEHGDLLRPQRLRLMRCSTAIRIPLRASADLHCSGGCGTELWPTAADALLSLSLVASPPRGLTCVDRTLTQE